MRIKQLIEHLQMFPEEMEVFIQTIPSDFCQPISIKTFSIISSYVHEKEGHQKEKLLLTAFIPTEKKQ